MWYGQFDPKNMNPTELKIHVGRMQAELESKNTQLQQRSRELQEIRIELQERGKELNKTTIELSTAKVKLDTTHAELKQRKGTLRKKFLALIVSILFGTATILFNLGNSMITANPPDTKGNTLIFTAAVIYIVASLVTIFILGGSNS